MLTRSHDIFLNNCSPLPPVLSLDHIVPRLLYHYSCPGQTLSDSSAFLSPCLSVSQCKIFPRAQTAHCCRGQAWQTKECTCTVKLYTTVNSKLIVKNQYLWKIERSIHPRFLKLALFWELWILFAHELIQNGGYTRFLNYMYYEIFKYRWVAYL